MSSRIEKRDNIAIITQDEKLVTYGQLAIYCDSFLRQVSMRSLIIILASNTLGSIIGYLACLKGNHVPLLLDQKIDQTALEQYIRKYTPGYIWVKKNYAFTSVKDIYGFSVIYEKEGYVLYQTYYPSVKMYDRLAVLLTTSGTTGNMKTVRLSKENLKSNTISICSYLKIQKEDSAITVLPMSYTYGLSVIHTYLYVGAKILLTDRSIMDKSFWKMFKKYSITSFSGVPYTYEVLRKIGFDKMEIPSLRVFTQAGGRLGEKEWRYFQEYAFKNQCKFYVMYGQTEATARISYLPFDRMSDKVGSVGKAIPGGKIELVAQNKDFIAPYEAGEIIYTGANVMLGYAESQKDLWKGDELKGKLFTGDIGYFDLEGYLYITGRQQRFIKLFGRRISLDDVEQAVFQMIDEKVACVEVENNLCIFCQKEYFNRKVVIDSLCKKFGLGKREIKIVYIKEFPYISTGKIDYKSLIGECR